jgi:transmembrane sensor
MNILERKVIVEPKLRGLVGNRLSDAALWHEKLHSDAANEKTWSAFVDWLEADNAHGVAFDQVEDLYAEMDEAGVPPMTDIEQPAKVTVLSAWRSARRPLIMRAGGAAMALMAASVVVAIGIDRLHMTDSATEYATRIGETRKLSLADGSVIEMNTGSALSVTFNKTQRHIRLEKGEALFRVAKDASRPFLVTVGDRDVRDVGTVFNVLRNGGQVTVTVSEGMVAVSPRGGQVQSANDLPVQVSHGEQLVVKEGALIPATVRQVDPATVLAWRDGYLTFKDAPLSQVANDLNRYFINRIALKDQDIGSRRFSGVLKVDNEEAVVTRLTQLLPLAADHAQDGTIILRLKAQGD